MKDELMQRLIDLNLRKEGKFTLHSGIESNVFWDIKELYRYPAWVRMEAIREFVWKVGLILPTPRFITGIRTGGLLLAKDIGKCLDITVLNEEGLIVFSKVASYEEVSRNVLVDDVMTMGETIRHALQKTEAVEHIAVLINRSGKTKIGGIPIISGVITDIVG